MFWGASIYRDPMTHMQNMQELFDMYAKGLVKPRISARFPLQEAAKALTLIAERKVLGKVVLIAP